MGSNQISVEWGAISARIKSLMNSGVFFYQSLQSNSSDPYGASKKFITPSAKDIFNLIGIFKNNFESTLPAKARTRICDFIQENTNLFNKPAQQDDPKVLLVALSSIESEISYYLNDTQTRIRKTVEVAFAHLQRQLIADKSVKEVWSVGKIETDYEKLGGAHLLLHKIWAFKVDAVGEKTDLVLSEPFRTDDVLYQSADGLVLTEWKVVRKNDKPENKISEAKAQAQRYSGGSLAALELSSYRYLIMVSQDFIVLPQKEIIEGNIVYRVINIAYAPSTPSKSARRAD